MTAAKEVKIEFLLSCAHGLQRNCTGSVPLTIQILPEQKGSR